MAVRITRNTIPDPSVGSAVERIVLEAVGARHGDWTVEIREEANELSWRIAISGPHDFKWSGEFWGPDEQNPIDGYAVIRRELSKIFPNRPAGARILAFLSYANADNEHHFISQLGTRLARELQVQTGEAPEVVWAKDRARPGEAVSNNVGDLARGAVFLVPVLSPSYFRSDECRKELEFFLARETGDGPRVFPIYFVTAEELESDIPERQNSTMQALRRYNIFDFRQDRFDLSSGHALRITALLAKSMRDAFVQLDVNRRPAVPAYQTQASRPAEAIYIETLRLKDFRCFEELELNFNRPSRLEGKWTCIAGINGAGKSAILQALGVALLGDPLALELGGERLNRMRRLADAFNRLRATVELGLRAVESHEELRLNLKIDEGRVVSIGGAPPSQPLWEPIRQVVIAGYGATRNLSSRADSGSEHLSADARRQITLFDPLMQLAGAEVLVGRRLADRTFRELFQNVVKQVFEDELQVDFGFPPPGHRFMVSDTDVVEAIDLPDGFRSAAAWLADLCSIWCEKTPDIAANGNPGDLHAIVLIDEIDMHLHPSLQRALIPRLRKTFPKVQWIVTTHSPLVLANFDVNEIIALDRDQDGNIRELDRQILGFTSDQIYEWLMGTRPMGAEIEEEQKKSDAGVGKDPDEMARLMRISPEVDEEAARKRVTEFRDILKALNS